MNTVLQLIVTATSQDGTHRALILTGKVVLRVPVEHQIGHSDEIEKTRTTLFEAMRDTVGVSSWKKALELVLEIVQIGEVAKNRTKTITYSIHFPSEESISPVNPNLEWVDADGIRSTQPFNEDDRQSFLQALQALDKG